jgi:hypothetical protein
MRMYFSLLFWVLLALAGCGVQSDQWVESQSRETYENVEISTSVTASSFGCTATTECTTPYDFVPKSCSGQSCSSFADRVVCDGHTVFCNLLSGGCSGNTCQADSDCSFSNRCGPSGGQCKNKCCQCLAVD